MNNLNVVVPVEVIEADLRLILSTPEMYHDKIALATLVSHLYSYVATYKLKLEKPLSEWNVFVKRHSRGNSYFSNVPNISVMRNLLKIFLIEQYQRNGEVWISA